MNKNWYISLISGMSYCLPENMCDNVDKYQIKLTQKPKGNCKKCFGRGYSGFDQKLQIYMLCNCIKKIVDPNQPEITIETPRLTNDMLLSS